MQEELFARIQTAITELDEQNLAEFTEKAIEASVDPVTLIEEAYIVGIQRVGELFDSGEYFLPELVLGAKMVAEAISKVKKLIPQGQGIDKGKVVIGTVKGDIHDIGKNLVIMWLSTRGIEVVDIGVDCPPDTFIDRALEENADIIGASSLLTMTAPQQKELIERIKERELRERFRVIVGGAAVNSAWAEEIGADGYARDLREVADLVLSLLAQRKGGK